MKSASPPQRRWMFVLTQKSAGLAVPSKWSVWRSEMMITTQKSQLWYLFAQPACKDVLKSCITGNCTSDWTRSSARASFISKVTVPGAMETSSLANVDKYARWHFGLSQLTLPEEIHTSCLPLILPNQPFSSSLVKYPHMLANATPERIKPGRGRLSLSWASIPTGCQQLTIVRLLFATGSAWRVICMHEITNPNTIYCQKLEQRTKQWRTTNEGWRSYRTIAQ